MDEGLLYRFYIDNIYTSSGDHFSFYTLHGTSPTLVGRNRVKFSLHVTFLVSGLHTQKLLFIPHFVSSRSVSLKIPTLNAHIFCPHQQYPALRDSFKRRKFLPRLSDILSVPSPGLNTIRYRIKISDIYYPKIKIVEPLRRTESNC